MEKDKISFWNRYFTYANENISGTTYWMRQILNTFLILFFGLGLYLMGLTCYKRAKAFEADNVMSIMAAIMIPIFIFIPQLTVDISPLGSLAFQLPHLFFIFKNGNKSQ
jgi:uncharacterized membrane protein YhaH (DUF805 family)